MTSSKSDGWSNVLNKGSFQTYIWWESFVIQNLINNAQNQSTVVTLNSVNDDVSYNLGPINNLENLCFFSIREAVK